MCIYMCVCIHLGSSIAAPTRAFKSASKAFIIHFPSLIKACYSRSSFLECLQGLYSSHSVCDGHASGAVSHRFVAFSASIPLEAMQ